MWTQIFCVIAVNAFLPLTKAHLSNVLANRVALLEEDYCIGVHVYKLNLRWNP